MLYIVFFSYEDISVQRAQDILHSLYPEYPYDINDIEKEIQELLCKEQRAQYFTIALQHEGKDIFLCDVCTSTQDIAKMLYDDGNFSEYALVISKEQRQGRGQGGSSWASLSGNALASLRLPYIPVYRAPYTTVLLGALVTHFLRTLGIASENKWINDILIQGRKVGGILLEEYQEYIVCGIGINIVTYPPASTALYQATCLQEYIEFPYSPVTMLYALREFILMKVEHLITEDIKELRKYIEVYLAYKGKPLVFETSSGEHRHGYIEYIGENGELCIRHNDKLVAYTEGSIHHVIE